MKRVLSNSRLLLAISCLTFCMSCIDKPEHIIYSVCKDIIKDSLGISYNISYTPYIKVQEIDSTPDSSFYEITVELYQHGNPLIACTDYWIINGVYVFLIQEHKKQLLISSKMQEELYTWGPYMHLEAPTFMLRIDKKDLCYELITDNF